MYLEFFVSLSLGWIVSFLSYSVFRYDQPDSLPQTWPKRREWNLHVVYKHRKRNFEDFVLPSMILPAIFLSPDQHFGVSELAPWEFGRRHLPVLNGRGQSSWLFLLAVVSWTFLSLTCTVLGLLKYPWRLRNFLKNIPPKVKFSRQVKFQFRISGQAVGEETRTRNFPSHALIKQILIFTTFSEQTINPQNIMVLQILSWIYLC